VVGARPGGAPGRLERGDPARGRAPARRNEAHAALHRDEPWASALARLEDTIDRAIALSERFADRLEEPVEHPWNNHGTIRDLFHGVCGHQEEHRDELRAWRESGGLGSRRH
jgi:hypothetical protein